MAESIRRKRIQINYQMTELEKRLSKDGILMTQEKLKIVEMNPMDLLSNLKNGILTAAKVLQAFQAKALEVTRRINCVTEFIPEAESWAEACDLLPPEERGPLHGIPVSIKESVNVKGMDTTIGLSKHLYNPVTSNAVLIDVLIQRGAIPFCKTNIPQTMFSLCCSNPVYGITKNPHDLSRTPGGSSGGEGALIAGGGSVLGIGSDLGGSIRIPAAFSGCVGLKPTGARLSSKGIKKILEGQKGTESAVGVMGRDVEIVAECMKAFCTGGEMVKEDPVVVPVPWNDLSLTSERKLRFGYFDSIDAFPTAPGVKRGVHLAKEALEKAGHEVIPFEIEDVLEILLEAVKILRADDGKNLLYHLEGEILEKYLWNYLKQRLRSSYIKPFQIFSMKKKSKLAAKFIFENEYAETFKYWKGLHERTKNIYSIVQKMREKNIDLLLSPVVPIPAPQDGVPTFLACPHLYVAIFNYYDFPSGTIPVSKETEEDQKLLANYPEDDMIYSIAKRATKGALGLPIGVLVTGFPWEEELVCRGMLELQKALKIV